jgi:hypothetical protein
MPDKPSVYTGPGRGYRSVAPGRGETAFQVVVEETDLWVVSERDLRTEISGYVHEVRGAIKTHIALHPEFLQSMAPLRSPENAHPLIRTMCSASQITGVGPMAGVAGAIAQSVADRFKEESANILVENGGDVFMHSTGDRVAGILADPESRAGLGVKLAKADFPISLCASSARIGHSLSLGRGDIAVVASHDAALADCAATALCNMLQGPEDLKRTMDKAASWRKNGVLFAFAQCAGKIAVWGELELTALE